VPPEALERMLPVWRSVAPVKGRPSRAEQDRLHPELSGSRRQLNGNDGVDLRSAAAMGWRAPRGEQFLADARTSPLDQHRDGSKARRPSAGCASHAGPWPPPACDEYRGRRFSPRCLRGRDTAE